MRSDRAIFNGKEKNVGIGQLLKSVIDSVKKVLKHGPRILLTYNLWVICYYEKILKGDLEKARDYSTFIIISIFIMFAQFQMRYSTLIFDQYYKNNNGQTVKFDDI